tara:strand:- start:326 stop:739 length:414 start_codon:yes stop_codon:yes gene_type:complete
VIFEREEDLKRERRAIETFVSIFEGSFQKLDPFDIDFKVFDKEGKLIAYVEVKGRIKTLYDAYPLPLSVSKLHKIHSKRLNPTVIWACEDGIIYGRISKLEGELKWGGRAPREGATNDEEPMVYFDKQKNLKYVRYS